MTTNVVSDEQLGAFARRQADLFRRVREGTIPVEATMRALQDTIEGNFDAVPQGLRRLIDCDAAPYIPNDWKIKPEDQLANRVRGQFEFDPGKIKFHLDDAQKKGTIVGNNLMPKLASQLVLPANVLDHGLANTNLLPESWKVDENGETRYIYFWGTIYRDSRGSLCVRCLYWDVGLWHWNYFLLDDAFGHQSPAASLAS